jgi:hypothetical protein
MWNLNVGALGGLYAVDAFFGAELDWFIVDVCGRHDIWLIQAADLSALVGHRQVGGLDIASVFNVRRQAPAQA